MITTGGVSVGEADFTRELLGQLGEVLFWKIAMRPGRPMAFGADRRRARFFGLPGNPVAVMVTFYAVRARGAARASPGAPASSRCRCCRCRAHRRCKKSPGPHRVPARHPVARRAATWTACALTGQQGSGVLRSMSEANCFIVLEHERGAVKPGDPVSVQLFEGLA